MDIARRVVTGLIFPSSSAQATLKPFTRPAEHASLSMLIID
jgi:hypothetical protein